MTTNFKHYGDIFAAPLVFGSDELVVLVNEPKAMQYLLTHDTGQEFTAPGEPLLEPVVGRQSMMLLSGNQHRNRRQLVMPPFQGERLKAYGKMIQQITQDAILLDLRPHHHEFVSMSFNLALYILFLECDDSNPSFHHD